MVLVNTKLDISGHNWVIFRGCRLYWSSSFLMAQLYCDEFVKTPIGRIIVRAESLLRLVRRELLRELFSRCNCKKLVHYPLLDFSVYAKADQIVTVYVLTYYSTTQYLANSSPNSSRLINRRCEWTLKQRRTS